MPNRIRRTTALPVDLFADEAIFEIEIAEIWHRDWIFATTVDAVAEPGDFVPVTIGRQPIIVARGDDYQIRALSNVCSHRGAPLVDCPGRASRFSCPYHAWTYDLEGELVSVPYAQPDEVASHAHGLDEYRVETWHGLVFVCLDDEAPPFTDKVAHVERYVRPLGIDRLHHDVGGTFAESWKANWKLVYANALDSYSHFRVHAETIEPISPTDASYYLAGSAQATVSGGESAERADHVLVALPPSFVAVIYPDSMLWQALTPSRIDQTVVSTGVAGEQIVDDGSVVSIPGWDAGFIDEDRAICERLQLNASVSWRPGPLLALEQPLGGLSRLPGLEACGTRARTADFGGRAGVTPRTTVLLR